LIEELAGRKVIGFMSDNHIDPTCRSVRAGTSREREWSLTISGLEPSRRSRNLSPETATFAG
jgi:hypothetical protein